MRKVIAFALLAILVISFTDKPKQYKVSADLQTWQVILNVIDRSKADPDDRIAARDFIIKQLSDTTINK